MTASPSRSVSAGPLQLAHTLITVLLVLALVGGVLGIARALTANDAPIGDGVVRVSAAGVWLERAGTVDGAAIDSPALTRRVSEDYGPLSQLSEPQTVDIGVAHPGAGIWALVALRLAAQAALVLGGLWLLRLLLAEAIAGRPFGAKSVRLLQLASGLLVAYWTVVEILRAPLTIAIIERAGGDGSFSTSLSFLPLIAALGLLALAEIWRHGHRLQRDAEGTI